MVEDVVVITKHAYERFQERFKNINQHLGFEDTTQNHVILHELFRCSEDFTPMLKNKMAAIIKICEKHHFQDMANLHVRFNENMVFVCHKEYKSVLDSDQYVIKTILDRSQHHLGGVKLSDFLSNQKTTLMTKPNLNSFLSSANISSQDYIAAMKAIMDESPYHLLINESWHEKTQSRHDETLDGFLDPNKRNTDYELDSIYANGNHLHQQHIQQQEIKSLLNEKLEKLGLEYVMTLDNGECLCFAHSGFLGFSEYKNQLLIVPQMRLKEYVDANPQYFETFGKKKYQNFLQPRFLNDEPDDVLKKTYIRLLLNADPHHNGIYCDDIYKIKTWIFTHIPEHINDWVKINQKNINCRHTLEAFNHFFLKTDEGLQGFMSLVSQNRHHLNILCQFDETERNQSFLCQNILTNELSLERFHSSRQWVFSEKLSPSDYLQSIMKFIDFYDGLSETDQNLINQRLGNKNTLVDFIEQETNKYIKMDRMLRQHTTIPTTEPKPNTIVTNISHQINENDNLGSKMVAVEEKHNLMIFKNSVKKR